MTVYHKHHIIPRHAGGTDDPSNIVELTVEEHAEAHRKLWEEYGRWQDKIAWEMLSGHILAAEAIKRAQREYMTNRTVSKETRKKMSESNRRRAARGEHPLKGFVFTDDSRKKMSESHMGQVPWNKGQKMSCEQVEKNRNSQLNRKKLECFFCGKMISGGGNLKQHLKKHSNQ